ncbi:MAG: adenylate/guanylate cyclase domain-containing protein [Armatimonadota bacterium]
MQCPSCGSEQLDTEVVCQACGELLTLSSEELARVERYRLSTRTEILCVMFCDISGFTSIADRSMTLSSNILAMHMIMCQSILERDGAGEIVNTAGDGVLAVFANPATATERALEMQAILYHRRAGTLRDERLQRAFQQANLEFIPSSPDGIYQVHTGMHLGIVTRGGRTSRDVFGHNVNIACRVCNLAGPGQIYMTEAVYDNARLIIGDRDNVSWQVWKDMPIRGVAAPMTVVGVAQQPYQTITMPRGMKETEETRRWSLPNPMLAGIGAGLLLLLVGIILGVMHLQRSGSKTALATVKPGVTEHVTQIIIPQIGDNEDTSATATALAVSSATLSVLSEPDINHSTSALPTIPETTPSTTATVDEGTIEAELRDLPETVEKSGTVIQFINGQQTISGKVLVTGGAEAVLVAVAVGQVIPPQGGMSLLIDGNSDGKLQSANSLPYGDVVLGANSPSAIKKTQRYAVLANGQPGNVLTPPLGVVARSVHKNNQACWLFRIPLSELGVTSGSIAQLRLHLWPSGVQGMLYAYPAENSALQEIKIP